MGVLLTAHNFNFLDLPYYDLKEEEWRICLKLAKAAGSIPQFLVNHLELNKTYRVTKEQVDKIAAGIKKALDHHCSQMALPDGSRFVELPKHEGRCRHFAKWAQESGGFSLFNTDRRQS